MIAELERYHGVVFRQLIVASPESVKIGVANVAGRIDAFSFELAAFQIKHSSKRLSPWSFTYLPENLEELTALANSFDPVWAFLVCGGDGVVGISHSDLKSIVEIGDGGAGWVRVSRSRNSMYRVSGALGELDRAIPRGVQPFLDTLAHQRPEGGVS